jgi:hypothetical protein
MSDALQPSETYSTTGKRLSGVNARRRRQSSKRLAMLGPSTNAFWVSRECAPSAEAFQRLRDAMHLIHAQIAQGEPQYALVMRNGLTDWEQVAGRRLGVITHE